MVKALKFFNMEMLCFWKMKLSRRELSLKILLIVATPIREYGVTQVATHEGNETIPIVEVPLRRSQREKRHAISRDYEVYLNECDYDIGLENDPTSYDQAIKVKIQLHGLMLSKKS